MTPDDIANALTRAFENEDRAGFDATLAAVRGSFTESVKLADGWKLNTGKNLDPETELPIGLNRDQDVSVLTRGFLVLIDPVRYFRWGHFNDIDDIIAYNDYTS